MRVITRVEPPCPPLPDKKRVAAYARVSSGKDAMLHSLSAQVSYFSSYIQSQPGWELYQVFVDEAWSGTKDDRPQFRQMIEDCKAGRIHMIITKSVSRFARNTVTLLKTVHDLKDLGVDVYFQEQNIHTISSDGEFLLTILASYAQEESRSVSENCKWRIRNDFKKGNASAHRIFGYRYKDGELIPDPDEARIVRLIYDDYLVGMGKQAISNKLRSMGIKLGANSIIEMLRNEKYIGDMVLQKHYVVNHITKKQKKNCGELPKYLVKDSHEPIIDRDTYSRVQDELARRAKEYDFQSRKPPARHLFTGLIRCGMCGAPYHYKMFGSAPQYKKPVWICRTFDTIGKSACSSQQIPESILIAKTREAIGAQVLDESVMRKQIKEIQVPAHNRLAFHFADGTIKNIDWQNPSRRESWTPEMKESARRRTNERNGVYEANLHNPPDDLPV